MFGPRQIYYSPTLATTGVPRFLDRNHPDHAVISKVILRAQEIGQMVPDTRGCEKWCQTEGILVDISEMCA